MFHPLPHCWAALPRLFSTKVYRTKDFRELIFSLAVSPSNFTSYYSLLLHFRIQVKNRCVKPSKPSCMVKVGNVKSSLRTKLVQEWMEYLAQWQRFWLCWFDLHTHSLEFQVSLAGSCIILANIDDQTQRSISCNSFNMKLPRTSKFRWKKVQSVLKVRVVTKDSDTFRPPEILDSPNDEKSVVFYSVKQTYYRETWDINLEKARNSGSMWHKHDGVGRCCCEERCVSYYSHGWGQCIRT